MIFPPSSPFYQEPPEDDDLPDADLVQYQKVARKGVDIPLDVLEEWVERLEVQSDIPEIGYLANDMRSYFRG
jgi:hypothetical protein